MNQVFKPIVFIALAAISIIAFAADGEFPQLRKDVTVMEKILLTEFERGEGVRIDGNYLAKQGAVFTITPSRGMPIIDIERIPEAPGAPSVWIESGDEFEFAFSGDLDAIVAEALASVGAGPGLDSELRAHVRELTRETRELERELSRLRVQRIHVDEQERESIDKELEALSKEREKIESRREDMSREMEVKVRELEEKRKQIREERAQARMQRLADIESKVLRSLCDYGSTLSNLPNGEHVSLILTGISKDEQKIFVFERNDVTGCKSGSDALTRQALQYMF